MLDKYLYNFFHIKHKWLQTLDCDNIKLFFFFIFTFAEIKISLDNCIDIVTNMNFFTVC